MTSPISHPRPALEVAKFVANLDFFRPSDRKTLLNAMKSDHKPVVDAISFFVGQWAVSDWVDGCVYRLGRWVQTSAPEAALPEIKELAGNSLNKSEGHKRAWGEFIAGMNDGKQGQVDSST